MNKNRTPTPPKPINLAGKEGEEKVLKAARSVIATHNKEIKALGDK